MTKAATNEKRRLARIPLARAVVVRERLATWRTETRDVGARGCGIALVRRTLSPGALVHLEIERAGGAPSLAVVGQVAWARSAPVPSAGIAFVAAPRDPYGAPVRDWIDVLVADELREALTREAPGSGALLRIGTVPLHLGIPPSAALDPSELAVLRVARDGGPLSSVCYAPDGLRALVGLLERGAVTVGRTSADPEGWKRALSLLAEAAAVAQVDAARVAAPGVIVPPLPETAWRQTAIDAMTADYLRSE